MAAWTRAAMSMAAGMAMALAADVGAVSAQPAPAAAHDLMPAPAGFEPQAGQLVVDGRFTLASTGTADPRIDAALARARQRLAALGVTPSSRAAGAKAALVVAATGAGKAVQEVGEDESYELTVDARQARLTAPNPLGVLRGLETFLQLARADAGRVVVPAVRVTDRPRFPWRGLLL
ncbi:MAG TPA: beta-N-acetylhexosaminidase family protein, partial [Vicinamibacteria bacterium]|nr:beta-N-acetylhexosaminidase family protein [Vicinamibacteria bacterium]